MGNNSNPTGKGGFGDNRHHQNKNGRPRRGKSLTDLLRKELKKKDVTVEFKDPKTGEIIKKKISGAEAVAKRFRDLVIKDGYWPAMRELYNRLDGKPLEQIMQETELTLKDYTIIAPDPYDPNTDFDLQPKLKDNPDIENNS